MSAELTARLAAVEAERDEAWHFLDRDLADDLKTVRAQRDGIARQRDAAVQQLADLRANVAMLVARWGSDPRWAIPRMAVLAELRALLDGDGA